MEIGSYYSSLGDATFLAICESALFWQVDGVENDFVIQLLETWPFMLSADLLDISFSIGESFRRGGRSLLRMSFMFPGRPAASFTSPTFTARVGCR